jgi:predicted GTPase
MGIGAAVSRGRPEKSAAAGTGRRRLLILGAAGRDFHDFNTVFREDPGVEVVAFTAAQIPDIAGRRYPASLAGPLYPAGIPIRAEGELEALIEGEGIDEVVFAYSDLSHEQVMHLASRALAKGAGFRLSGPAATMLRSSRPVVSVCAVRTGCGKSPATRWIAGLLKQAGLRVGVVRHPMPYGDLERQAVQRLATPEDLVRAACTIEEREEYEPHLAAGHVVYAGVDYQRILRQVEAEADLILWDGGNNDLPFFASDLEIVLVDPHRLGHERTYFPGEVNLRRAHVVVVAKVDTARFEDVAALRASVAQVNPRAEILEAALPAHVDHPELIAGRRVLVIEDGPTLTHGGMSYGAGVLAARRLGALQLVDPRPHAAGSIRATFAAYPHIGALLPATGYSGEQVRELAETIAACDCDAVLVATPVDLRRLIAIDRPVARLTYAFAPTRPHAFERVLSGIVARSVARTARSG